MGTIKSIHIWNTLSSKKEEFIPIEKNKVRMYVCGVTVYDVCHIGHARAYVVFDTIRRTFEHHNYTVNHVQNFTDIDDKIIKKAIQEKVSIKQLTEMFIRDYFKDMDELNILRASKYPKATECIPDIHRFIDTLIEKEHAYESDGDVFFEVNTFEHYGKLSKKKKDELISGSRIEVNEQKKNPLDFVLWKKAKDGEPFWESPWGNGRPGWHIECSAMVQKEFNDTIDIHGGGEDLMFPHHENEICQSEACTSKPLANYWIHNGFVNVKNEKMSKSLNNFISVKDLLHKYTGSEIRFYLLRTHYRHNFNFSLKGLDEAKVSLVKIFKAIASESLTQSDSHNSELDRLFDAFNNAIIDDFNFPEAIGYLFEMTKIVNATKLGHNYLVEALSILGIEKREEKTVLSEEVQQLFRDRERARSEKNYAKSDEIRDLLLNHHNIQLEDTPNGVQWHKV